MSKNISVCLICTGKYDVFLPEILKSIDKYFLVNHSVTVHVFTDKMEEIANRKYISTLPLERIGLIYTRIPTMKFPEVTLYRYKTILEYPEAYYGMDYVYYMDVDMRIVKEVGEEIFAPLVAVAHPGYSIVGGGAWCDDMNSLSYVLPNRRHKYIAGGFQGGQVYSYVNAMKAMDSWIEIDASRGVTATWHDESHWNRLYSLDPSSFLVLNSGYCMVENDYQRKLWKIDGITPYILALDKDHKKIRE